MRKLWVIIKREYITRVRTKGFVIATISIPLLTAGVFGLSVLLATRQRSHTLNIATLDEAGGLSAAIARGLTRNLPDGQPLFRVVKTIEQPEAAERTRADLRAEVVAGGLDGYLVVPKDVTAGKAAEFHTRNPGDFMLMGSIESAVSDAVIARRLEERGIHVDNLKEAVRGVEIKLVRVTREGETEEKGQTFLMSVVLALLLYSTLIMYGIVTMRSVLEEKTTRIVEVLVSAVRPFQLMAGKILGVGAVAFTQYLIWTLSIAAAGAYGATMASAAGTGNPMRNLHVPIGVMAYLLIYFLTGYFLYASIYAAIGAASSNEQDAQQLQWPATLPLVFSFLMFNFVLRDPASTVSVVLSEIPFFAPILMLLRITSQTPPFWQIALSMVLLILTTVGVVYVSARIYRVGVLMHGKRPSLVEIFRWLKYT